PGQVAQALVDARLLPDHGDAFLGAPLHAVGKRLVGERDEREEARGGGNRAQPRLRAGAGNAAEDGLAGALPPPRELVARQRLRAQRLGLLEEAGALVRAEDTADEQV